MIENGKTIEQLNYLSIITPQNTRISWDDYFSILAKMTSMRSSDKHRKVGSVIVSQDNRILSTGYNNKTLLKGARIYTTLFPCNNCMKAIIQSGISEVIYLDNHNFKEDADVASRYMARHANPLITLRPYEITEPYNQLVNIMTNEESALIPMDEVEKYDEEIEKKYFSRTRSLVK